MENEYTNIYGGKSGKGVKTGIDLSQVEKVTINGQEYLKFVNPSTNEVELLENFSNDSLQTQFEKIRDYYSIKQGSDAKENTNKILDFKKKHDSEKLKFSKVEDMVNNYGDYEKQLSSLNSDQMRVLKYLIVNRKELKIDKINLEKGIAIDAEGKVVEASINPSTNEINAKNADTTKFEYQSQTSFAPSSNQATIDKGDEYNYEKYMEYPELLDKEYEAGLITLEQKEELQKIIAEKSKENEQLTNSQQKQYVYVLKDDRKAGFVDYALYPAIIVILGLLIIISIIVIAML